jgi:hypothetical protein
MKSRRSEFCLEHRPVKRFAIVLVVEHLLTFHHDVLKVSANLVLCMIYLVPGLADARLSHLTQFARNAPISKNRGRCI